MIPRIRRPQIFGIAAVIAAFLLVEFMVGEHSKGPALLSNEAQITPPR